MMSLDWWRGQGPWVGALCFSYQFLTAGKGPSPGNLSRVSLLFSECHIWNRPGKVSSLGVPGAHSDLANSSFSPQGAEADRLGGVHPYRCLYLPGTCAQGTCLARIRASAAVSIELMLADHLQCTRNCVFFLHGYFTLRADWPWETPIF